MLGDIERIPIITLSGCKSLSEILADLPLPQPCNDHAYFSQIITDPYVAQTANSCLESSEGWLVEALSTALAATSTDTM